MTHYHNILKVYLLIINLLKSIEAKAHFLYNPISTDMIYLISFITFKSANIF